MPAIPANPTKKTIGGENTISTCYVPETNHGERTAKSRRCYHRVISGIERGGELRFLTLTSSNDSPDSCQRSWRALYMRLKRRGKIHGYIKVPELSKNGKQHLHVLFRGSYIDQKLISHWWQELHQAKVVDIRRVSKRRTKSQLASYMAKYMSKENMFRYSWNWEWVWRGFCNDWKRLKHLWRELAAHDPDYDFKWLLRAWRLWLKGFWTPDFAPFEHPPPDENERSNFMPNYNPMNILYQIQQWIRGGEYLHPLAMALQTDEASIRNLLIDSELATVAGKPTELATVETVTFSILFHMINKLTSRTSVLVQPSRKKRFPLSK